VNKTSVSQSEVSQTATALFNHEYWRATKKERDERLQERFDRIGLGLGKGSSND
jgi:hypothetical protein